MKLNLMAPINQLGYGHVGCNFFKQLSTHLNVSLFPIPGPEQIYVTSQGDADLIKQGLQNAATFDSKALCLKIYHQFKMDLRVGSGPFIGMPIFELDTFSDLEKHHLSNLDYIIVNSVWAKQVVENNLPDYNPADIFVCPLGYDPSIFFPANDVTQPNSPCVFLNVGKWEIRKGHDILVDAFNKAFDENDNVELWMLCENPFYSKEENQQWSDLYRNSKLGAKIRVMRRVDTQSQVAYIMNKADCGVFPSRGEGWNLDALEMMALGKQIIITDYSGHKEFANANNSRLVPITDYESAYDGKWFHNQGSWGKITPDSISSIVEHMREVYQLKKAGQITNSQGITDAGNFTWQKSGEKLVSILKSI